MEIIRFCILTVLLLLSNVVKAQVHIAGNLTNSSAGFNIIVKQKANYYLGFGATFFRNKGNIGQDLTNFTQPNADVYEVLKAADGSIYGTYGRKYKNYLINLRLGAGNRKWIYNGKTGLTNWYVVKDGGTYLLYGADIRKTAGRFDIGLSYDNFNRAGIMVGFHMLDH